jgi:tRNA G26 N,N-dimethylase Trm1
MMNRIRVYTTDKEIYDKLWSLHFTNEVFIRDCNVNALSLILKNINSNGNVVHMEKLSNNQVILKKIKPIDFSLYYKR